MKKILVTVASLGIDQSKDELPQWYCLFPEGINEVEGEGQYIVDRQAWNMVRARLDRRGIDIVFDYEHQTMRDGKAPASGWCRGWRYTDGVGIEAKVDWTDEAAEHLKKGEYRYFSQVFYTRRSDKRLFGVHSMALTNAPKTNHLQPLLAKLGAELNKENNMLKKLIAKLGLAPDATEEDVLTALTKLLKQKPTVAKMPPEVTDALGLKDDDTVSTVVASIHALNQTEKTMVSKADFEALQAKLLDRDVDEVVAKATADGKITPDQKDWAEKYAKSDLDGFKTFVAKAPVVVPIGDLPKGKDEKKEGELDAATLTVAKLMDVDEADLKKFGSVQ